MSSSLEKNYPYIFMRSVWFIKGQKKCNVDSSSKTLNTPWSRIFHDVDKDIFKKIIHISKSILELYKGYLNEN